MAFTEATLAAASGNLFKMFGKDLALLAAGDARRSNAMTIAWGQLGVLWSRPVATVYVRPQRYTREFMEAQEFFSVNFFAEDAHRAALNLMGTKSGRDGDKMAEAGLHTVQLAGTPAIQEARLVLVCRKLYAQDILPGCFLDAAPDAECYPKKDYHRMYVGQVEKVFEHAGGA